MMLPICLQATALTSSTPSFLALFSSKLVVRRKFQLSEKSAVVSNDTKLAARVAKELASFGIFVQVARSTRDLGVMFTASSHRDFALSSKRLAKARLRNNRIVNVSKVTRSARKLFTSGAYPQGTWGHQCVGLPPPSFRRCGAWPLLPLVCRPLPTGVSPLALLCVSAGGPTPSRSSSRKLLFFGPSSCLNSVNCAGMILP